MHEPGSKAITTAVVTDPAPATPSTEPTPPKAPTPSPARPTTIAARATQPRMSRMHLPLKTP
jgi:hypothetical protein